MDPIELYQLLATKPFQPVRVHVKDGRVYAVPLRMMVVVCETTLDIGIQALGELPGICERIDSIPLAAIDRIEPFPAAANGPVAAPPG